jgi:hypothetical protein
LAPVVFNDKLHVFATGTRDGRMYFNMYDKTGKWSGWGPIPGSQATDVAVAAAAFDNRLFLFSKGLRYQRIYVHVFDSTDSWSTWSAWSHWEEFGGGGTTDAAVAASAFDNRLFVLGKGVNLDKLIYVNTLSPEGK